MKYYNILCCFNQQMFQKKRESPEAPTPDSTTVESKSYICGEEVLVNLSDERFYLGFIAKVNISLFLYVQSVQRVQNVIYYCYIL